MTINEAIQRCDSMKPNAYSCCDKRRWLSDLDGMVFHEIFKTHTGMTDDEVFSGYDGDTPGGTTLLVTPPYEDVYIKYLFAQIDFNNAEYTRYNNDVAMFQVTYNAYADYCNRTYMPKQAHKITL